MHSTELNIIQNNSIEYFNATETKLDLWTIKSPIRIKKQAISAQGVVSFTEKDLFIFNLLLQKITSKFEFDNKILHGFPVKFRLSYEDIDLEIYLVDYDIEINPAGFETLQVGDYQKKTMFKYQFMKIGDVVSDVFDKRKKV